MSQPNLSRSADRTLSRATVVCAVALTGALLLDPVLSPDRAQASPQITWKPRFYDPAGNANLVLPLPCGGAMAFQRIDTPVPPDDPIKDRTVQLGLGETVAGYVSYLRRVHLRGGFTDESGGSAHYFIGRYEVTRDQYAAIGGECAKPSMGGTRPAAGLSWFDAVEAARMMTEWLRAKAPGALPEEDKAAGFIRLPTEAEWEYAVRGGAAVDVSVFNQRTFPIEGPMRLFAWHQGATSARGSLRPVGRLKQNPLGLHDVYGNVEELMLEPFRMNALGRPHGQLGGVVTRGGSILTTSAELSSGLRQEFSAYGARSGRPVALSTFGARFVIGIHLSVSTRRTNLLNAAWLRGFREEGKGVPGIGTDLTVALDALIGDEIEHDRRARLQAVRLLATEERRERQDNRLTALRASILGGAILIQFLRVDTIWVERSENAIAEFDAAIRQAADGQGTVGAEGTRRLRGHHRQLTAGLENRRKRLALNLLSYERNLVTSATEYGATERRQALDVLLMELKLSGRDGLIPLAREFHGDIATYGQNSQMTKADIRRLALE